MTIESLIAEAEAARAKAMSEKGGAAAAVSALTAKAKRIKHRVPKQRNPLLAGVFHSPRVAQRTTAAGSGGWSTSGTPEAFTRPTELKPTAARSRLRTTSILLIHLTGRFAANWPDYAYSTDRSSAWVRG